MSPLAITRPFIYNPVVRYCTRCEIISCRYKRGIHLLFFFSSFLFGSGRVARALAYRGRVGRVT